MIIGKEVERETRKQKIRNKNQEKYEDKQKGKG